MSIFDQNWPPSIGGGLTLSVIISQPTSQFLQTSASIPHGLFSQNFRLESLSFIKITVGGRFLEFSLAKFLARCVSSHHRPVSDSESPTPAKYIGLYKNSATQLLTYCSPAENAFSRVGRYVSKSSEPFDRSYCLILLKAHFIA